MEKLPCALDSNILHDILVLWCHIFGTNCSHCSSKLHAVVVNINSEFMNMEYSMINNGVHTTGYFNSSEVLPRNYHNWPYSI